MNCIKKAPQGEGLAGLNDDTTSPPQETFRINSPNARPSSSVITAAAVKDLTLDAATEAARIASIAARHFVENCDIGDYHIAEYNLGVAVAHLREAALQFRKWQGKPLPAREGGQ